MPEPQQLLQLLADGRFHSGEALGRALGVSRSAVWKALRAVSDLGLEVHAVRGKGYRLSRPLELLDVERIREAMDPAARALLDSIEVFADLDSTSRHLLRQAAAGAAGVRACLAEHQYEGRGRRGRHWVSPFGANLYLSVLWRFASGAAALGGLSLAVGVAVMRTLTEAGVRDAGLKWPNDVLAGGAKLAGVLIDVTGESAGPCTVVVGVGVNVHMPAAAARGIDQEWTDLERLLPGRRPDRNVLAARLLGQLLSVLRQFALEGFAPFRGEWRRWDLVAGRPVRLWMGERGVDGVARAVDDSGALLLESDGVLRAYSSGEVTLRVQA